MTTSTLTEQGIVGRVEADAGLNVFQAKNAYANANIAVGGTFNFGAAMKFSGLSIPRGATILDARISFVATQNGGATSNLTINALDPSPLQAYNGDSFGPAWRQDLWGRFKAHIRNTSAGTIIDTNPGAGNSSWGFRFLGTLRERVGQSFVPPAPDTLGEVLLNLQRFGAPAGDLFVEIYTSSGAPTQPTTLLATSDLVSAATVGTVGFGDVSFAFSGAEQIALAGATEYFAVLRGSFVANLTDYISWRQQRNFFSIDGGRHYGTGADFDNQNFPGVVDIALGTPAVGAPIAWAVPTFVIGFTLTTQNLAAALQSLIDADGYASGDDVGFKITAAGGQGVRRWAAFGHPTYPAATLAVTWEIEHDDPSPASVESNEREETSIATLARAATSVESNAREETSIATIARAAASVESNPREIVSVQKGC